jgi:hypothetical protein
VPFPGDFEDNDPKLLNVMKVLEAVKGVPAKVAMDALNADWGAIQYAVEDDNFDQKFDSFLALLRS